ncbi:MAG: hypothetical protein ACK53L_10860, partial [Pirellulaceae bacterium]
PNCNEAALARRAISRQESDKPAVSNAFIRGKRLFHPSKQTEQSARKFRGRSETSHPARSEAPTHSNTTEVPAAPATESHDLPAG